MSQPSGRFRGRRNPLLLFAIAAGLISSACLPVPEAVTALPSTQTPELTLSPAASSMPTAIYTVTPLPTAAPLTIAASSLDACSSLRSGVGSTLISMTFVNHSKEAVNVNWINYQGSEQYYFTLQPGQSQRQETYMTHVWCARDKATNAALLVAVATKDEQVATVLGEMDCTSGWTRLKLGMSARVSEDLPTPNRIRKGPDMDAEIIYRIDPGRILHVVEGPICTNGLIFWQVESSLIPGGVGWTAEGDGKEYYLEPIE